MITIKNDSAEDLEIVTHYDPSAPGFRVVEQDMPPQEMKPGGTVVFLGYEPGISYSIQPVKEPELPRTCSVVPGAFPVVRSAT